MTERILLFAIYIILFSDFAAGQDTVYARAVVNELTSPSYHGRGYVKKGDKKAAAYIAGEFSKLKVKSFGDSYYQAFDFPVNTFPSAMRVVIDDQLLVPGTDYIVHPASSGSGGSFAIVSADTTDVYASIKNSDECLVVDMDVFNADREKAIELVKSKTQGALILLEEKKLTWSVAGYQLSIPVIIMLKEKLPADAKKIRFKIKSSYKKNYSARNVIATVRSRVPSDSFVVFSAHYDHLGRMGSKVYFPGANDNASGVAMLLNLAKHYSSAPPAANLLFIAFAAEEAGLIGSKYFTENPPFELNKIKCLINLDLLGTGDDGLMVVNATEFRKEFELLKSINEREKYIEPLGERGKARNSDHYYFSEKGIPSFFLYTMGGITAYHDVNDVAETLPLTEFSDVFRLIRDFTDSLR